MSNNKQGDILQEEDGVVLNTSFWECQCELEMAIHFNNEPFCNGCKCWQEDCTSAREDDVQEYIYS